MKKLIIILSIFLLGTSTVRAQIPLPQPPQSPQAQQQLQPSLTSDQRKLKARQDSLQRTLTHYVQPGKKKSVAAAKDTASRVKKPGPGLAKIDSAAPRDPQKFMPSLDRSACKSIVFFAIPAD